MNIKLWQPIPAEAHGGDFSPLKPTAGAIHSPPQTIGVSEDRGRQGTGEEPKFTELNFRNHQIYLELPGSFFSFYTEVGSQELSQG